MKIVLSIILLSLTPLVFCRNAPRVNSERIKREDVLIPEVEHENVNDEKISDEGWVQRPSEDTQPSSDEVSIDANEKPSELSQTPQGNVTSLETLQIGSVVVDATRAIAGAIATIAGGVVQATEGIVGMIYRPPGNFTFGPRESCKLRISDEKTKLYKDTQMNCVAMSRLIRDVEVQSQKVDVKESVKVPAASLKCVFIRTKTDTTELEKIVDCDLLQAYTKKYAP